MAFSKALSTMCQMVEKGKMFLGGHFGILEIGIHFAKRQFFTGEILCFILNHLNKTQNWDEKYVFFFRKSTFIMCCMICLKFCPSIPWIQINHLHIGNTVKLSESVKTMKCHKNHSAQYKFPLKQSQLTYYKKKKPTKWRPRYNQSNHPTMIDKTVPFSSAIPNGSKFRVPMGCI